LPYPPLAEWYMGAILISIANNFFSVIIMVLIFGGNSVHVAHARRKIGLLGYENSDL